ncbi:MAG: sulfatase [Bacteroidota bacterium]
MTRFLFLILISGLFYSCKEEEKRPNILFAIADDATYMHFGAYGCDWVSTPAFDRIAKEGLLFSNAYTPNAKCAPSRAAILTGRNSWQLEEIGNHLAFWPEKYVSFMEVLKDNGYRTGHTVKGWAPGDPGEIDGKRRELTGEAFNEVKLEPPTNYISKVDYASNFEIFLDSAGDQPFMFWYGSVEPHRAYEFMSGADLGKRSTTEVDHIPEFYPDNDTVRNDFLDYGFEIEYFDSHLGKMIHSLEKRNLLENTIIIVTADNGMPFPRIKGNAYEYSNHLPLAIMWGEGIKNPGRVIEDYVSFIDYAPTILEAAGVDVQISRMQPITGFSLLPIFNSDQSGDTGLGRNHVLIGKERHDTGRPHDWGYPIRGIIKDDYLYLKNFEPDRWPAGHPLTGYLNTDGSPTKTWIINKNRNSIHDPFWKLSFGRRVEEELYNIKTDPSCVHNLILDQSLSELTTSMREQLMQELLEQQDPRMSGNGSVFDDYLLTSGENFFEKFMEGDSGRTGWVNKTDFETREFFQLLDQ